MIVDDPSNSKELYEKVQKSKDKVLLKEIGLASRDLIKKQNNKNLNIVKEGLEKVFNE